MANDYFRFKEFIIHQSGTAMKVGTDGVLIGAWAKIPVKAKTILDIGTGTGLIALMLAQRFKDTVIKAIEIDELSFAQAVENVKICKFAKRIEIIHKSLQEYALIHAAKFDLIVSNPPYFSNSLNAQTKEKTQARHQIYLKIEDLFEYSSCLLNSEKGIFSLIIPFDQKSGTIEIASKYKLFPKRILNVRTNPDKDFKRCLLEFSFTENKTDENELTIELFRHNYSKEYMELTSDFYLKF